VETAVFLDRDNTLIANDGDLGDPDAVRLIDGVAGGLKALRQAGYRLIVVTNQGGVARGKFTEDDVDAVHQRIATLVDETAGADGLIDRFYYCPYNPQAELEEYRRDHPWRKPHPGMLLQAARDLDLDLARCWMIGDQKRDVEAARAAGCRTLLVTSRPEAKVEMEAKPDAAVMSFAEAVDVILGRSSHPAPPPGKNSGPRKPGPGRSNPSSTTGNPSQTTAREAGDLADLNRTIAELTDEIRSERLRRAEFTGFRLAAGLCQLLVLLLALLGLLQLGSTDAFIKWMLGAVLAQLLTIAILLLDLKG
jgi:D-glycero-D-manno-heptose 1,7-bisphosphate phosphatase